MLGGGASLRSPHHQLVKVSSSEMCGMSWFSGEGCGVSRGSAVMVVMWLLSAGKNMVGGALGPAVKSIFGVSLVRSLVSRVNSEEGIGICGFCSEDLWSLGLAGRNVQSVRPTVKAVRSRE